MTTIEIRFKDTDPDTGKAIGVGTKIATCEDTHMARWVVKSLELSLREAGEPNREIYCISKLQEKNPTNY